MKNMKLTVSDKFNIPKYPESPKNCKINKNLKMKSSGIQISDAFKETITKQNKIINLSSRDYFTPKANKINKLSTTTQISSNKKSNKQSDIQNKTTNKRENSNYNDTGRLVKKSLDFSAQRTGIQTIDYLETSVNRKQTSRFTSHLKDSNIENIVFKKLEKNLNKYNNTLIHSHLQIHTQMNNKTYRQFSTDNKKNNSVSDKNFSIISKNKKLNQIRKEEVKNNVINSKKPNRTTIFKLSIMDNLNPSKEKLKAKANENVNSHSKIKAVPKPKLSVDFEGFNLSKGVVPLSTKNKYSHLNSNSNISNNGITPINKTNIDHAMSKISTYKKYVPLNLKLVNKVPAIQNSIGKIKDSKEINENKQLKHNDKDSEQFNKMMNKKDRDESNSILISECNTNNITNRPINNIININKIRNIKTKNTSHTFSTGSTPKSKPPALITLHNTNLSKSVKKKNNQLSISNSELMAVSANLEPIKYNNLDKEILLRKYYKILKNNEIEEIKIIDEIYFLGLIDSVTQNNSIERENSQTNFSVPFNFSRPPSAIEQSKNNSKSNANLLKIPNFNEIQNKYDDENSNYKIKLGDHLNYRYEIISELGKGSFGQAIKCYDHKTKERVCVKIIKNKKKFSRQAKIEISLLEYIKINEKVNSNEESNLVKIKDHFIFRNHICIVFELLDINLYELIKNQEFKGLDSSLIRKLCIQILKSLIYLQKHCIIHCDLKPENILLKQFGKTGIKVIDFGSSCFANDKLYTYIQSRFYRAPEIILGMKYGIEIDMWSFGCILAELFSGIPIFPGENEMDQFGYIMEYLGIPTLNLLEQSKKRSKFFDDNNSPILTPNSRGKIRQPNTKRLSKFLKGCDDKFLDLVKKCLEYNPEKRIKPDEAILHPWVSAGLTKDLISFYKTKNKFKLQNLKMLNNSILSINTNVNQLTTSTYKTEENVNKNIDNGSKNLECIVSQNSNKINYQNQVKNSINQENINKLNPNENFIKENKSKLIKMNSENKSTIKPKIDITLDLHFNINSKGKNTNTRKSNLPTSKGKPKPRFSFN